MTCRFMAEEDRFDADVFGIAQNCGPFDNIFQLSYVARPLVLVPARDVDDLVQDVFLTAYQRLGGLRDPGAFGGWLAAMARNRAVDYHRAVRPTVELEDVAGSDARHRDEALAVLAVLQTLPHAYRETLTLRLVEGMTGPEIAARTGLTPGSVRVNLHRGMQQLRAALQSERGAS